MFGRLVDASSGDEVEAQEQQQHRGLFNHRRRVFAGIIACAGVMVVATVGLKATTGRIQHTAHPEGAITMATDWLAHGGVVPNEAADTGNIINSDLIVVRAVSAQLKLKTGDRGPELSAQELVDCVETGMPFGGSDPRKSIEYLKTNGLCAASDYPWQSRQGRCRQDCDVAGLDKGVVKGFKKVEANDQALEDAVRNQPVIVGVAGETSTFMRTHGKILHDCHSSQETWDTSVGLLVGFDDEFWKVQMDWGVQWGNGGIVEISRKSHGCMQPEKICGYPEVEMAG